MPESLREEIKQSTPFGSLEQEALLNLERTAALLGHQLAEALKAYDVTPTQVNVLRILRGARPKGLCRNEIRDRLVAQVPDVTRLLDRLARAGLIARARGTADRRLVTTRITAAGLKLLARLDAPLEAIHHQQLGHLTQRELASLVLLLTKARQRE